MPLKLKEAVTLFLSVRRGLEGCLINEIRRNPRLNSIERIHSRKSKALDYVIPDVYPDEKDRIDRPLDVDATRIKRYGNDKWLYIPNQEEQQPVTRKSIQTTIRPQTIRYVDSCNIRPQSGGLEVKCNREWLIGCVLGLRTVESVWLRVGIPFRCHNRLDLTERISLLPWPEYIPQVPIEKIPLRIISKHSSVWSSVVIEECVREGVRKYFNRYNATSSFTSTSLSQSRVVEPDELCVSVNISRNTCYVAVQCSSRLSPRHFNFVNNTATIVDTVQVREGLVPFWSLSKTKLQAHLEARQQTKAIDIGNQGVIPPSSPLSTTTVRQSTLERRNFIENQQLISDDKNDIADVLVAGILHADSIVRKLRKRPLRIWNPFCGSGLVLSEIIALVLQLPNFTLQNPPSPFFRELAVGKNNESYKDLLDKQLNVEIQGEKDFEIVGSETSLLKLAQAAVKLDNLYSFYRPIFREDRITCNSVKGESTVYRQYRNRLPVSVALHQAELGTIAPLMSGSMVIAKIPCMKKEAGSDHAYESIKAYRLFGNIIGARSDWNGVYAIVRGRAFEHFSGLEWHCVAKATSSRGGVTKLLRWTGKSKVFKTPEERSDQLNELDFV